MGEGNGFGNHVKKLEDEIAKDQQQIEKSQEQSLEEKLKNIIKIEGILVLPASEKRKEFSGSAWIEEEYSDKRKSLTLEYVNEKGEVFEIYEFDPKEVGITYESSEQFGYMQLFFRNAGIKLMERDDFKLSEMRAEIKQKNKRKVA